MSYADFDHMPDIVLVTSIYVTRTLSIIKGEISSLRNSGLKLHFCGAF